jgi:hypothetical protein
MTFKLDSPAASADPWFAPQCQSASQTVILRAMPTALGATAYQPGHRGRARFHRLVHGLCRHGSTDDEPTGSLSGRFIRQRCHHARSRLVPGLLCGSRSLGLVVRRSCESSTTGPRRSSHPHHSDLDRSITSPYLTSIHRGEQAWTALGSAIRVAQSLGLHRLTSEPENLDRAAAVLRYGDIWGSRVDREVGRRFWCSLASLVGSGNH